jgi:hypothetical protein
MDQHDHPLDHLLLEEFVVPIVADSLEMQIISPDKKYQI